MCYCMNNGSCVLINNEIKCDCPLSYSGSLCNETKPTTEHEFITVLEEVYVPTADTLWPVLLGCLLGLVALIGGVSLLMYILWRRRILWVMKMKYFFQPSEESDGRTYDAFVSYCGSKPDHSQSIDEEFVILKLRPKLENELGYSLCLHQRDFIPGEAIADNIITAVDKSRRTILILSQSYVMSEWCKLEYNVAHQEMLKLQHRIIPIMMENPDGIPIDDPILEKILKNITYIKYPGEENEKKLAHFWKKIQYSMPKKRILSDQCSGLNVEAGENIATDREDNEIEVI